MEHMIFCNELKSQSENIIVYQCMIDHSDTRDIHHKSFEYVDPNKTLATNSNHNKTLLHQVYDLGELYYCFFDLSFVN